MLKGIVLALTVILTSTAFAKDRYIVIMKSKQAVQEISNEMTFGSSFALKGYGKKKPKSGLVKANASLEDSLMNLNSVIVSSDDSNAFDKIKADADVQYIEKEYFHEAPGPVKGWVAEKKRKNTYKGAAKTPWGIFAVKAPEAWDIAGKGDGARVLVLDTGIDAAHPSLKANFEAGHDFTGASDGSDFSDEVGHGTHVAGTIAGVMDDSGFTGVAPEAKILAGRVCGEQGCSNIAIAQGINWGIEQKVDVISMSLGGAWSTPAERDAISKADKSGISVVAASGNDGSGKVSYPAALTTVIAVGAVDKNLKKAEFSQYGPELAIVAPGVEVVSAVPKGTGRDASVTLIINGASQEVKAATFAGAREVTTAETKTLVNCGLGKPEDFVGKNVKGRYALISRGEIKFGEKVANAIAAGATGAVIYNNAPGLIHGSLTEDGTVLSAAVFMIEQTSGQALVKALDAGQSASAKLQTLITDYSAFDGTSMATPHVSGVVALMKAANKALKPAEVKQILKSTATPLSPNDQNQLGAGIVNAEAAVEASIK